MATRTRSEPDVTLSDVQQQQVLCGVLLRRNRSASAEPDASVRLGSNQAPSEYYYFNISVVSLAGGMYTAWEALGTNVSLNSSGNIELIPHADSQLGPILNALELFHLTAPAPNLTFV